MGPGDVSTRTGAVPPQPGSPHLEDDSHDRQVQGLPRHRGRPLVNLIADCEHRWPASEACPGGSCPPEPPGATAGMMMRQLWQRLPATHPLPGRAPACRSTRGQPGSAAPGTAGRRAGGTPAPETAGPRAGEMSPQPLGTLQGPLRPSSSRVAQGGVSHRLPRNGLTWDSRLLENPRPSEGNARGPGSWDGLPGAQAAFAFGV